MKRSKRLKRRGRAHRSNIKRPRAASIGARPVEQVPDFALLPNAHDQFAIDKLRSAPLGGLAVDLLIRNDPQRMPPLRDALVGIYFKAAEMRKLRRATRRQLSNATSALNLLEQAIIRLESVSNDGRDGLRMLVEGSPLDDEKGEKELSQFAAGCWKIRLDVASNMLALQGAIGAETKKPSTTGERRKRLRTLLDALASWWLSGGGKSLAPYVRANRRDGDRAIVHGRSGKFLSLAVALLCEVDVFKTSEVEAAVTNVHEARLTTKTKKVA
jgi:hypothetical protein